MLACRESAFRGSSSVGYLTLDLPARGVSPMSVYGTLLDLRKRRRRMITASPGWLGADGGLMALRGSGGRSPHGAENPAVLSGI